MRIIAVLIGIALAVGGLAAAEFFARHKAPNGPVWFTDERTGDPEFDADDAMGYGLKANAVARQLKRDNSDGHVVYDATYRMDAKSRRITPISFPEKRSRYALFLGCSFVFGEGVDEKNTLPYWFGELAKDYRPYNYGVPGAGPHQVLARFEKRDLRKEVDERDGFAVYVFIPGHIERAIGAMANIAHSNDTPFYELDSSGKIHRNGTFETGRPVTNALYHALDKLEFLRALNITLPLKIADEHYRLVSQMIIRTKELYEKQFGNSNFLVLFYPYGYPDRDDVGHLTAYLNKAGVKTLDLSREPWTGEGYNIPHDGHPLSRTHREVAARIVRQL